MEKTTRKLNDLLSQFLSLRNEVSEIADKTADAVFDSVESRDITKGEALDIPEHISNRKDSTTIRICRREILQLLQNVITNNNLFHLKRKWNKLMIKEPSASES